MKVKAEKYGMAVPFVCLNKYSSDNARGIALSRGPKLVVRSGSRTSKRNVSRDKQGGCNLAGGGRKHSARHV